MSSRKKSTIQPEIVRTFRITIKPAMNDQFGIDLNETYGLGTGPTTPVIRATPAQVNRVIDALMAAVKASGHTAGRLATEREVPIPLDEPAGVRLALTLFATQPVTRHERIRALVAGVNSMSVEETFYWYAKSVGPEASRARRALRLLLADEKPEAFA